MNATKHEGMYQAPISFPCWHSPTDAAKALGVAEATIRRACKRAGVQKIRGQSVAGMVELSRDGSRAGYMPYHA